MARRQSRNRGLKKVILKLAILRDCVILFPVMRDNSRAITEGIRRRAEKGGDMSANSVLPWLAEEQARRAELMKGWEAIPEAQRPTWEQFKRGLKTKKEVKELTTFCDDWNEEAIKAQECECEICKDSA